MERSEVSAGVASGGGSERMPSVTISANVDAILDKDAGTAVWCSGDVYCLGGEYWVRLMFESGMSVQNPQ